MTSDPQQKHDYLLKIVIVGDHGICKRRTYQTLSGETYSLDDHLLNFIGVDFRVRRLWLDSKLVKIQVWHPTGGERFRTILPSYFRGTDGFVVVYDNSDANALRNLESWLQEIEKSGPPKAEKFIVAASFLGSNGEDVRLHEDFTSSQGIPVIEYDFDHLEVLEESFQNMVRLIIKKRSLELTSRTVYPVRTHKKRTCIML